MLTAVLFCAMTQVYSVSLDPVPSCPTCNALTARVASLEAQLSARSATVDPPRRVRLIQVSEPAPVVTYTAPVVTYSAPLGAALPSLAAWAPGSYVSSGPAYTSTSYVQRRGLFGGRFMATSVSACGPGGCP